MPALSEALRPAPPPGRAQGGAGVLPAHRLTVAAFDALARGGGGVEALGVLARAQRSKRMLLLRAIVEEAGDGTTRDLYAELARAHRRSPGVVDDVLAYPAVGVWAWRTLSALTTRGESAALARLAGLVAACAARLGERFTGEVPVRSGLAALPSLGAAHVGGRHAAVRVGPYGTRLVGGHRTVRVNGEGWLGLSRRRAGAATLVLDDVDPDRFPPGVRLRPRLAARETGHWWKTIAEAVELLRRHHPGSAEECLAVTGVLTPVAGPAGIQVSASSRHAFGSIALSVPVDAPGTAVTLVHEVQHSKLNALMDLFELAPPDTGERFYAPWRSDPRPVDGLLHGAYAHLGIARFWRVQRHVERNAAARVHAHVEYVRWRDGALAVSRLLAGRLLPPGERLAAGMREVLESWLDDPVPPEAARTAAGLARDHRERWKPRRARAADPPLP
ncbi:HEXXH motif domain-containing protein [Sinosporangium siamense]|uniref:HEXXH motif domain-containing protein n=1 Tax=Sinosporangium siamense TaxID=1367973 RepID=A0A919V4J7_9ACTN|nr:HEXXH motif domain-containing protein [Sinosporangium siamense]